MTIPFFFLALISTTDGSDAGHEVHLNRSSINSIDVPRDKIVAEPGGLLRIRFMNHGAPIHITITASNAGAFTSFFHENLYVVDESTLAIPILMDCPPGTFDLDIISGYGVMKAQIPVSILPSQASRPTIREEYPLQPVAHGRPHPLMLMMGVALFLYCAWFYTGIKFLNIAAFITLIVGALYTWYRQQ
ncbi:DUF7524 family protein [Methanoregula formicica]|uniref:Uncharacterized protein n=1 Tax=Methanoregula formicica (strain DSM 22288 / NBRC 105244 / SMSP) TaxID=593750 RepID=L0HB78_METFS|nr:hypothetical protein [Methanoregula formicica]AGB01255.1 hypothetical protein Metfor_0173 [Methanoregula formicica SMSP]